MAIIGGVCSTEHCKLCGWPEGFIIFGQATVDLGTHAPLTSGSTSPQPLPGAIEKDFLQSSSDLSLLSGEKDLGREVAANDFLWNFPTLIILLTGTFQCGDAELLCSSDLAF